MSWERKVNFELTSDSFQGWISPLLTALPECLLLQNALFILKRDPPEPQKALGIQDL